MRARIRQARRKLGLAQEACGTVRMSSERTMHDLDCTWQIEGDVPGPIDLPVVASANLGLQVIGAEPPPAEIRASALGHVSG